MASRALIFILAICLFTFSTEARAETQRKFRIGVITPLTGKAATYGTDVWNSLQFAAEKLGRDQFELLVEDDKCMPGEAAKAAQKLALIDRVDAVVGPVCSGAVFAAAPILERARIPVMITNASADKISEAGDYIFRSKPSNGYPARVLFDHISQKHKRLGMISEQTDFAQDIKLTFTSLADAKNLEVIAEDFLPDTTDFRSLLVKMQKRGMDGLLINPQTEETFALILRQVKSLSLEVPLYGIYFPGSPTFLHLAGEDANGIVFAMTPLISEFIKDDAKGLFEEFSKKYGGIKSIEVLFATTYEGFRALRDALTSEQDVRKYLYTTNFNGIWGSYSFDERGEILGMPFKLKRIVAGKITPLI